VNDGDAVETIPDVVTAESASDYLAVMTRAVFQTGLRWGQIAQHWGAYVRAFSGFDCARVAAFDEIDVEGVLATPGVLHSPRKVRATVANARALMELDAAPGGIRKYLRSFPDYASLAKDFKKRFAFMGDMNVWYVLFRVGEPVPDFEAWVQTIPGDHPRMREMVERAKR
jgi:3-methyladenine DNA glycosylase Tag